MSRISRKPLTRTLSAILLLASLEAGATQILHGKPDDTLAGSISRSEPTLIRIDGAKIRRVYGTEGDFFVTPDKEAGTAYIKPSTEKQTFSVFVSDDAGRTWKLLLSIADGPSDVIVIKSRRDANGSVPGRDLPRSQAIKRVVLALDSAMEGDMEERVVNEVVPLWNESLFVLVKVVEGPLRGEKYQLTNISEKRMVIDERELYRRGVVAISVERHEIDPGETTDVLVLSESAE